jgi:di/tricarboxylate transporter
MNRPPGTGALSEEDLVKSAGLMLVLAGLALAVVGLLVYSGALSWFGRLPGDLRWEGEHSRVYVPLTSMLLLSVVLSLLSFVVRRFL